MVILTVCFTLDGEGIKHNVQTHKYRFIFFHPHRHICKSTHCWLILCMIISLYIKYVLPNMYLTCNLLFTWLLILAVSSFLRKFFAIFPTLFLVFKFKYTFTNVWIRLIFLFHYEGDCACLCVFYASFIFFSNIESNIWVVFCFNLPFYLWI